MNSNCLATILVVALSGCASLESKPASGIESAKFVEVSVTCNRPSFAAAVVEWLTERKVEVEIVTSEPANGWHLKCSAVHAWDLAFFLEDAKITSYLDGVENGSAHYHLSGGMWSLDPDKFHTDETTVAKMLRGLYGL